MTIPERSSEDPLEHSEIANSKIHFFLTLIPVQKQKQSQPKTEQSYGLKIGLLRTWQRIRLFLLRNQKCNNSRNNYEEGEQKNGKILTYPNH